MNSTIRFEQATVASALFWMGAALIGVFITTVLAGIFPVGLLLPAWQTKVGSLILSVAHLAGIGAILILLAHKLDDDSDKLTRWVSRLSLWAIPVAIGFFLLIPLQTYNVYKLVRIASGEDRQAISQLQKSLTAIQSAQNEDQLRAALSQLPGSPPNIGELTIPLPQAKQRLAERLSGQIKKLDNLADERNARRLQQSIFGWVKSCLISLCYAAGFAEIARFPRSRNSLLSSIQRSMPWNRRRAPMRYPGTL